jgi:hypothetical protein
VHIQASRFKWGLNYGDFVFYTSMKRSGEKNPNQVGLQSTTQIERGKTMNIYGCKRYKMVTWLNMKIMFGKSRV